MLRRVLDSDTSLQNIVKKIDSSGESLEVCGKNIFNDANIQALVKRNKTNRRARIRRRVKKQYPSHSRSQLTKEINRRLKISVSTTKYRVKKTKQITIQQSFQPVKVKGYTTSSGRVIQPYRKAEPRDFTTAEKLLIKNNIRKTPSEIIKKYYDSGLTYRSETSIRRYITRTKKK